MAEIIGVSTWVLAGLRWGDWKNWQKYHATILFFILGDALYYYVSHTHRLWSLEPTWPLKSEFVCVIGEFLVFASATLIYLGKYPEGRLISVWWTLLWIGIFSVNEWILLLTGTFSHSNGWTLWDSFLFNIIMFIILRLHYKRPLLAYPLSILVAVVLIYRYSMPIH
jgi:hypothetical protein